MSVIYVVMPLGLLLSGLAVWVCVRAIESGQFDDLETPAIRAILDDDAAPPRADTAPDAKTPQA
ncbi:MAG: cbb3-type cytochrome oxidase assembly protein CcoS [Planctomycetota bacterium]